jgi:hypothetical protein
MRGGLANPALRFQDPWQEADFTSKTNPKWPRGYEDSIREFRKLLNRKVAEAPVQDFLERAPYLIPGIATYHHGPYEGIIATKLALGADFQSDFAYVTSNSQTLCFTGVEIESPGKKLFRKDDKFHRDYLDARQQITDWLFWAHHNLREALDRWGPLFRYHRLRDNQIIFRGILVFGRRSDFAGNRKRKERWAAEAGSLRSNLCTMTYDRILERADMLPPDMDNDKLVVCKYADRHFQVKYVCA